MTRLTFLLFSTAFLLLGQQSSGQTSDSLKTKIIGKWTLTSSTSKNKNECKKYYKVYTYTFDKDGNYSLSVTSSLDNSTITESGKYKIDNTTSTIYFFDITLTIPGQPATMANYQFKILQADSKLIFRQCLCDVSELDDNSKPSPNCKTVYIKAK